MERVGKVIEKKGSRALVLMRRHTICENCGVCDGILGGPDLKDSQFEVENPVNAEVGEMVKIEVDDSKLLLMSFVLYLIPVFALVAGILLGVNIAPAINFAGDHILFSAGMGLVMALFSFLIIRFWDKTKKDDKRYKPVITAIASEEECETE